MVGVVGVLLGLGDCDDIFIHYHHASCDRNETIPLMKHSSRSYISQSLSRHDAIVHRNNSNNKEYGKE